MADLLDIAPSTAVEVVKIGDQRVKVRGVSVDAIAYFVSRFPELKSLMSGGFSDNVVPRMIAGCGEAIGPIIAAGCGHLGDEEYERHASTLLPEYQLKFMQAIIGLTFPNGISSFVEQLTSLMNGATNGGAKAIKVRLKQSPSTSPRSSDRASHPNMQ